MEFTEFVTDSGWLITDIVIVTKKRHCVGQGTKERIRFEKMSFVKCKTVKCISISDSYKLYNVAYVTMFNIWMF